MLASKWKNFSKRVLFVSLSAGWCLKGLKRLIYTWRGCSKQWGASCYHVGSYLLMSFACGIQKRQFWWKTVPVWHCLALTSIIFRTRIFWHVIARILCSLIIRTSIQLKLFVDKHLWDNDPKCYEKTRFFLPKSSFGLCVADAESGSIGGAPAGRRGSAILSAIMFSTSCVHWMTMVCSSCPNTR